MQHQSVEERLRDALPGLDSRLLSTVTELVRAARNYELTEDVVRERLPRAEDVDEVKQAVISLGERNIIGQATFGDVAGGDLYKIIVNLAGVLAPPAKTVTAVVHKGLLAYDEADKDYFLLLLCDNPEAMPEGLPSSIRFWKASIEDLDPGNSFEVGYIWGPSGSGKSSLVKAGLLPHLNERVLVVYAESEDELTEARLKESLVGHLKIGREESLATTADRIVAGEIIPEGKQSVLIVLDQFEQWLRLHDNPQPQGELIELLRKADGRRLKVLLLVRSEFKLQIHRLFDALGLETDARRNTLRVDHFDIPQAKRVLHLFGQSYGHLTAGLDEHDEQFLERAIEELNAHGWVPPIVLSIFVELMKHQDPWDADTLKAAGGSVGLGVEFLRESFASERASAGAAVFKDDARALLSKLLPAPGIDLKKAMLTHRELADACGLAEPQSARRFQSLLRLLDRDLHLITPVERPWSDGEVPDLPGAEPSRGAVIEFLRDGGPRLSRGLRRGLAILLATAREVWGAARSWSARRVEDALGVARQLWGAGISRAPRRVQDAFGVAGRLWGASISWGAQRVHDGFGVVRGWCDARLRGLKDSVESVLRAIRDRRRRAAATIPAASTSAAQAGPPQRSSVDSYREAGYYRLTHDFLIRPLRIWLDEEASKTWIDRAQRRLAERTDLYEAKPEVQQYPSLREWLYILRVLPRLRRLEKRQRAMLRRTSIYHIRRTGLVVVLVATMVWGLRRFQRFNQERQLVQDLRLERASEVPRILREMDAYRPEIESFVGDVLGRSDLDTHQRLRLLSALPLEPGRRGSLVQEVPRAGLEDLGIVARSLKEGPLSRAAPGQTNETEHPALRASLWNLIIKPDGSTARSNAAFLLAALDPEDSRWQQVAPDLTGDLVVIDLDQLTGWIEGFRPLSPYLEKPLRIHYLRFWKPTASTVAREFLQAYLQGEPKEFAELVLDANAANFIKLEPFLSPAILPHLTIADREPSAEEIQRAEDFLRTEGLIDPATLPHQRDRCRWIELAKNYLAGRRANAALARSALGDPAPLWADFRFQPDSRLRTYLIHRYSATGFGPADLVARLRNGPEPLVKVSLILSLGEMAWGPRHEAVQAELIDWLQNSGLRDDHPGVHSAADWALRRLGKEPPSIPRPLDRLPARGAEPQWYVTDLGQTMVVFDPRPFPMGTPEPAPLDAEDREKLHTRTIGRKFAVATREVTVKEYTAFLRDKFPERKSYEAEFAKIRLLHSPHADSPVNNVTWIMAARYCDWLSEKDPNVGPTNRCYRGTMGLNQPLPAGYLARTGYRLPTEAEWEYTCRAGSVTLRPYGEDRELLVKYACVPPNSQGESTFRVGRLMPNDFGLFDMLGNVLEWCGGPYETYGRTDDQEVRCVVNNQERFVMRGGSFYNPVSRVRSAYRSKYAPDIAIENGGFRIARTMPASGTTP